MTENTNPVGNPVITSEHESASEGRRGENSEFSRFEDIAGRLMQVPKDEADEQQEPQPA